MIVVDASVVVKTYITEAGTDTATAKPGDEGEYKFIGLKPGAYSLTFHATIGVFADTTVSQVIVSGREDVHVPPVTLHP